MIMAQQTSASVNARCFQLERRISSPFVLHMFVAGHMERSQQITFLSSVV
jgi:hypothetical protein